MSNKEQIQSMVRARSKRDIALLERMGITPMQFERTALNAIMANPLIAECIPASIDKALIECIQSGLVPDGRECAIVPTTTGTPGARSQPFNRWSTGV